MFEVHYEKSCEVMRVQWLLLGSIHNNEKLRGDVERLPDLDELLPSSFDPDILDDEEEEVG